MLSSFVKLIPGKLLTWSTLSSPLPNHLCFVLLHLCILLGVIKEDSHAKFGTHFF